LSTAETGIVWQVDPEGLVWILKEGDITTEDYVENLPHGWTLIENIDGTVLV